MEQAWEAATLRTPSLELSGHTGVVVAADWMMEGNQVITASWDRTAILFDAETGEQVTCLTGEWLSSMLENIKIVLKNKIVCVRRNLSKLEMSEFCILENLFGIVGQMLEVQHMNVH